MTPPCPAWDAAITVTGPADLAGAVVDALATESADLVLIGVHPANDIGMQAVDLVLGMHPSTVVVVVRSVGDLDVLAPAYLRGPRGMLLWEPQPRRGTDQARRQRKVAVKSVLPGADPYWAADYSSESTPGRVVFTIDPAGWPVVAAAIGDAQRTAGQGWSTSITCTPPTARLEQHTFAPSFHRHSHG